jgi:tetratricopeptide (TPR) repeat protein
MAVSAPTPPPANPSPARPPAWWRRDWAFGLLLVLAALVVYAPLRRAGFVWDDNDNVTENLPLRSLHGLWRIWTEPGATQQFYPLTHTSFWIEYHLWGLNPAGYHLDNVLLHAASAILLWLGLRRLGVPGARLAAALFLLHPVCVESVAWVTERKNALSGVFYLGSLLAALRFWRLDSGSRGRRPRSDLGSKTGVSDPGYRDPGDTKLGPWQYYWLTLALYLCALGGKTAAVPLPAVIALLIWWRQGRLTWHALRPLAPLVAAGTALGLVTMWVEKHHLGTMGAEWAFSPAQRVLIAGRALWFYLGKLAWPHPLIFVYPRWQLDTGSALQWLAAATAAGGLFALWWARRGRWRPVFVAAVYFVLLLFPVLGFFNVYYFHYAFVSDHFQYLASIGPLTLAAAGITLAFDRLGATALAPAAQFVTVGALLLALATLTWRQLPMYADIETLYQRTIALNPACWLAYTNQGNLLMDRGEVDAAIASYQKAIDYDPDYAYARNDIGTALLAKGRTEEAILHLRRALELQPDYPEADCNLGNALLAKGRVDEAIALYLKALALRPTMADAHNNLANAFVRQGRVADAVPHYEQAVALAPGNPVTRYALGSALLQLGRADEAITQYQQTLALRPDYEDALYSLGGALLQKGRAVDAITPLEQAIKLKPDDASAHASLGDACYLAGRTADAIAHWRQALALNPRHLLAMNNLAWVLATDPAAALREGVAALALAENAIKLGGGGSPLILRTLAAAQAETGQFTAAAATAGQAVQLALKQNNPTLAAALQQQLQFYRNNLPFRDPGPMGAKP